MALMRFLPVILLVVLAIYCWIELAQSRSDEVRQLPKALWALFIVVPLFGPVAWLVYGRPNGEESDQQPAPKPRTRPLAPDDDPDFLRSIKTDPPKDQ